MEVCAIKRAYADVARFGPALRFRMFATTHFRLFLFRLVIARRVRGVALLVAMVYGGMALADVVSPSDDPFASARIGELGASLAKLDQPKDSSLRR